MLYRTIVLLHLSRRLLSFTENTVQKLTQGLVIGSAGGVTLDSLESALPLVSIPVDRCQGVKRRSAAALGSRKLKGLALVPLTEEDGAQGT